MIRTNVAAAQASSEDAVRYYKELSKAERAFRSFKSVDLKVRPIHHRTENRSVRMFFSACSLTTLNGTCAASWLQCCSTIRTLQPARRCDPPSSPPAQRSPQSERKARTKRTTDGTPVHSFHTLLQDLRTIALNKVTVGSATFTMTTTPTSLQQQALDLLSISSLA